MISKSPNLTTNFLQSRLDENKNSRTFDIIIPNNLPIIRYYSKDYKKKYQRFYDLKKKKRSSTNQTRKYQSNSRFPTDITGKDPRTRSRSRRRPRKRDDSRAARLPKAACHTRLRIASSCSQSFPRELNHRICYYRHDRHSPSFSFLPPPLPPRLSPTFPTPSLFPLQPLSLLRYHFCLRLAPVPSLLQPFPNYPSLSPSLFLSPSTRHIVNRPLLAVASLQHRKTGHHLIRLINSR